MTVLPKSAADVCAPARPEAGRILHWLALCYRRTPYFRGKWRLTYWAFNRWMKNLHKSDTIRLNSGLQIRCDLDDEIQNSIWLFGDCYERHESEHLRLHLAPGNQFLDVGANVGYYSLIAAHIVGPSGRVHAFEPISETFEKLRFNVGLNSLSNVTLNRKAISSRSGYMAIDRGVPWNSGTASVNIVSRPFEMPEEVTATTVDEYVNDNKLPKVDIIKIDVEGHEPAVITGATETLRSMKPILMMEINHGLIQAAGFDAVKLFRDLRALNYHGFIIQPDGTERRIEAPIDANLAVFRFQV
jgi:FkbM family methyltransferase